jgi:hypothetical protein
METFAFRAKSRWGTVVFKVDQVFAVGTDKKGTAEVLEDDEHRYFPFATVACLPFAQSLPITYVFVLLGR